MRDIIGFAGKMRCGKGVLSKHLQDKYGYTYIEIAESIKNVCTEILGLDSVDELNRLKNSGQKVAIYFNEDLCRRFADKLGVDAQYFYVWMHGREITTVRELLQTIATDVLRNLDENWHINKAMDKIINIVSNGGKVAVADIRFPNEKAKIEGVGGEVYYVVRDNGIEHSCHTSENSLSIEDFDDEHVIYNNGDENALIAKFEKLINV